MKRITAHVHAALLGLVMTNLPAFAQRPAPDSVPRDLAIALLTGSVPVEDLRVGRSVDGFPTDVLPADAVVVVSLARAIDKLTIATLAQAPAVALRTMQTRLLGAGWTTVDPAASAKPLRGFVTRGPPTPDGPGAARGFVPQRGGPPPSSTPGAMPITVCRGNTRLRVSAEARGTTESQLALTVVTNATACSPRPYPPTLESPLLPALDPPPGGRHDDNTWTGTPSEFFSQARVTTQSNASDLARHYGAQLVAAGWTATDSSSSATMQSRSFRLTESGGRVWFSVLTVVASTDNRGMQVSLWGRPR